MNFEFQEIQYFPVLVFVLVVGIVFHLLLLCRRIPLLLNIAVSAVSAVVFFLFLQQKTVVDDQAIYIEFGRLPLIRYTIPLEEITGFKGITYVRVGDIWAVQQEGASMPPFIAGMDDALLLQLKDGSRHLIGSQRVKELEQAIEKARRNGDGK
ncbi:MAG TPA: hypothetical protein DCZ05_07125 [Deltaproteobacteria bacterium]|nr:MAG: hypothetical protein A2253_03995 [Deltaproteobacteria bacterium RIFOXYA2_FULL_55_11]HBA39504.1 hypothetical protein [Deltaproteobacteria bacterium]